MGLMEESLKIANIYGVVLLLATKSGHSDFNSRGSVKLCPKEPRDSDTSQHPTGETLASLAYSIVLSVANVHTA